MKCCVNLVTKESSNSNKVAVNLDLWGGGYGGDWRRFIRGDGGIDFGEVS